MIHITQSLQDGPQKFMAYDAEDDGRWIAEGESLSDIIATLEDGEYADHPILLLPTGTGY